MAFPVRCLALVTLLAACPMAAGASPAVRGVVLASSNTPLPGARAELIPTVSSYEQGLLRLASREPEAVAAASTDALGRWALSAPGPGVFTVRITAPGTVPLRSEPLPLVEDLELPAAVLAPDAGARFVIRTRDGVQPGLWVFATGAADERPGPGGWKTAPRVGRTAGDGSLTLPRLEHESLRLHVFSGSGAEMILDSASPGAVTLPPAGASRHVRVLDTRGAPVPNVLVRRGDLLWPIGMTGADGSIEIAAAGPAEVRLLLVTADGRRQGARLGSGDPAIVLPDANPSSGQVLSAETGRPLAGALVWPGSDPGSFQVTGDDGRYHVEAVDVASAGIEARAPGRLPKRAASSAAAIGAGRLPTLTLERAAALAGRAVDPAGRGVPGAWVSASIGRGRPSAGAWTGDDGAFRLGLLQATELYDLQAAKAGFLPAKTRAITAKAPQQARAVSLVLLPNRPAVGRVLDTNGRPVGGAEIRLVEARDAETRQRPQARPVRNEGEPQAVADGSGRFKVAEIPALVLDVTVTRPGFARAELLGFKVPSGTGPVDLGTIRLAPGASISGQVATAQGQPVGGASVFRILHVQSPYELADQVREQEPDATTAADGRFTLADLGKGDGVNLLVVAEGFLPVTKRGIRTPLPEPLLIRLDAGSVFAGRVIDEEEKPVAGARLEITWEPTVAGHERMPAGPPMTREAVADSLGRFEVRNMPLGRVRLAADAAGFVSMRELEAVVPQPPDERMTIRLRRGATLEGRVATATGDPISGVRVLLGPAAGVSDGEGLYRVEGLELGPQRVDARHPQYGRLKRETAIEPGTNHLDLVFEPGQEVRGRVVNASNEPVPGAMVRLGSTTMRNPRFHRARSDAEGAFEISPVVPGTYHIEATAEGYSAGSINNVRVGAELVEGLEVVLQTGGRISGRILGLKPDELAGVKVHARYESGDSRPAEVDAAGNYHLQDLDPGDWLVEASVADGQRQSQARVPLAPGAEVTRDLEFGGRFTLSGVVLLRDEPLPDTDVSIQGQGLAVQRLVETDWQGRFRFDDLEADTYWLGLTNPGELVVHNQLVEVAADREVTIRLERSNVSGVVVSEKSREPLAEARVSLRHVAEGEMPEFLVAGGTDAAGAFQLPEVPAGRYLLHVTRDGYSPVQRDLEVPSGRDLSGVEVALPPSPGLELAVRLASGRPPRVLHLRLLSSAGAPVLADSRTVNPDGRVRLATVPQGSSTLLVSSTEGALTTLPLTGSGEPVAVTLPDAARLAVRVSPLATTDLIATLRILGADGRAFETLGFGGNLEQSWSMVGGKAVVDGVPAGAWVVQVTTQDGRSWTGPAATDGFNDAAVTLE